MYLCQILFYRLRACGLAPRSIDACYHQGYPSSLAGLSLTTETGAWITCLPNSADSQSRLYSYVSRMHRDQLVGSDPNAF